MLETLVVLEVASMTKVSDLHLRVLTFVVKEDILVLDVAVHNFFHVNVFESNCYLYENLQCLLFNKVCLAA